MAVQTMKDIIDYGAETYGSQAAFRYKVRKEIVEKTYLDVKRDSEAFGRALDKLGLLGTHVALIGPTSYEWVASYFGVTNSGGVAVPVDAGLPAAEVCELLNRADVSALVYDELRADVAAMAREKCPGIRAIVSMQGTGGEISGESAEQTGGEASKAGASQTGGEALKADAGQTGAEASPAPEFFSLGHLLADNRGSFSGRPDPDQLCAILFTSGTTGKSKGVMLTHRNLTDNAVSVDMGIPSGTVSMTLLPIHHAYCFTMDILKGLYIGLTICINDSIMHVAKNMKLFKPEIVLLVPMVIESIYAKLRDAGSLVPKKLAAKAAFGGNLKTICSGGAYLDPDYVDRFAEYGITILQGYGMTECSPVISTNLPWDSRKGSVGKLLPNCEAKVVDEEIWVRGSSVMQGYYKMPQETSEALEDGWLKTGDLGYVDGDGFVYITGRKKNLIILANGENVSPEELENQLSRSPLVKEILVRETGKVIQAEIFPDYEYVKKKHVKDVNGELQALIDEFNRDIPVYKRIHSLVVRETEFEKTPSKKIKRTQ